MISMLFISGTEFNKHYWKARFNICDVVIWRSHSKANLLFQYMVCNATVFEKDTFKDLKFHMEEVYLGCA